jgi:hypothetical protein
LHFRILTVPSSRSFFTHSAKEHTYSDATTGLDEPFGRDRQGKYAHVVGGRCPSSSGFQVAFDPNIFLPAGIGAIGRAWLRPLALQGGLPIGSKSADERQK